MEPIPQQPTNEPNVTVTTRGSGSDNESQNVGIILGIIGSIICILCFPLCIFISYLLKKQRKDEENVGRVDSIDRLPSDSPTQKIDLEMQALQHGQEYKTADDVKEWLISIELPQYYETFVKNGFEKLEFIKSIQSTDDLPDEIKRKDIDFG